jgi:hypothetical protein
MHKSIYILAHEDDTGFDVDTSEPITPEEIIDSQAVHDEFTETAASAQADVNAIEESNDIVNDTEDVTDSIDEKLEQPETVTADDVMVAQESMRVICHRYGIKPEMVLGHRVSHESASNNPIRSLEFNKEAAIEFTKKVIEGIRNIFKRLVVTIKKLFAKAVVIMSQTEKIANDLSKKIADYGEAITEAKFDDSEVASIVSKLGAVIVVGGGKLDKDPVKLLSNYIDLLEFSNNLSTYNFLFMDAFDAQIAVIKAPAETSKEVAQKAIDDLYKRFDKNNYLQILKKVIESANKFKVPKNSTFSPYSISGVKVRAFIIDEDARLTTTTLTVDKANLKTITVDVPYKESIIKLLGMIAHAGKYTKSYEKEVTEKIDGLDKHLETMSKLAIERDLTPDAKRSVIKYTSTLRIVVANLGVDSILAHVSGTKAILAYCNIAARKLTKPDKDKK